MTFINEKKVIFLGHRDSGKSWAVRGLICAAQTVPGYEDRDCQEGISVFTRDFATAEGRLRIHFWDYCCKLSGRYLYPIFMTGRAIYVVTINAREGAEIDSARYWLRNIRRYAEGCPVFLLLNSSDMSLNIGIDQEELKTEFQDLCDCFIVRTVRDLREQLLAPLLKKAAETPVMDKPLPETWERVIRELRREAQHEITYRRFDAICCGCGLEPGEQRELLALCRDLGLCFWFGSDRLGEHIFLQQHWLFNGLRAILDEFDAEKRNGMIHRDAPGRVLKSGVQVNPEIKRVITGLSYTRDESSLILEIMRFFGMLYDVPGDHIFLPNLCRSSMPAEAQHDIAQERNLEVIVTAPMERDRLRHELMIQMRRDLAGQTVWSRGVRFARERQKLSAVIVNDDDDENALRIHVRSRDRRSDVYAYMDQILEAIDQVVLDHGRDHQSIGKSFVFRPQGREYLLGYDYLRSAPDEMPFMPGYTYRRIRESVGPRKSILDEEDEELLCMLLQVCVNIQNNTDYRGVKEDVRNRGIRDMLSYRSSFTVKDQSHHGESEQGTGPGEVDLLFTRPDGTEWTIFEGLNIKAGFSERSRWNSHLYKLLRRYDKKGSKFLILGAYTECGPDEWETVWQRYYQHMMTYGPRPATGDNVCYSVVEDSCYPCELRHYQPGSFMKLFQCVYDTGGHRTTVIHIFIRLERAGLTTAGEEESHG